MYKNRNFCLEPNVITSKKTLDCNLEVIFVYYFVFLQPEIRHLLSEFKNKNIKIYHFGKNQKEASYFGSCYNK